MLLSVPSCEAVNLEQLSLGDCVIGKSDISATAGEVLVNSVLSIDNSYCY